MLNMATSRLRRFALHSRLYGMIPTLGLVAVFILTASSLTKADDEQERRIVGTWIGTTTLDTPPDTPPFVFTELVSFNLDGTVTGTNGISHCAQNPFVPPPFAVDLSDYFGSWVLIDDSSRLRKNPLQSRLILSGSA